MIQQSHTRTHSGLQVKLIAIILAFIYSTFIVGGAHAQAQDAPSEATSESGQFRLNIKPVSFDGSYFDLEMAPGESRQLTVEIGNSGDIAGTVVTYAGNVHSLVNGGMGLGDASEAPDLATSWVAYESATFVLEPGMAEIRTFAVNVPDDAAPRQYISSIVVHPSDPENITSGTGGISLGALTRHGMAIAITVPGDATPAMNIGAATHTMSSDHSVVSVEIENTGATRLLLSGEFILFDNAGAELTRFPVTMGVVYARTGTTVEVPFGTILNPGTYSVSLSLSDESRDFSVNADSLPLIVEEPEVPVAPDAAQIAIVDQQAPTAKNEAATANSATSESNAAMLIAVGAVAGCAIAGLVIGGGLLIRRQRGVRARSDANPTAAPAAGVSATSLTVSPELARPSTVTQLVPRSAGDQIQS